MLIIHHMTLLRYFYDVAEQKSFSKAAKKNFISQSAISQAMQKLEKQLGHPLFLHHRNLCELSPDGRILFDEVQKLMSQMNHFQRFVNHLKDEKIFKVHFGCMHSIALALLAPTIKAFKKENPNAIINFELGNGAYLLEQIDHGNIDFGILLNNQDLSEYHTLTLYQGYHEVYEKKEAASKKLMISNLSVEAQVFLERYQAHYQKKPEIEMEVSSWEVIARLTEAGLAWGYFPDYLTYNHKQLVKVLYPFPSLPYEMVAVFKSKSHMSQQALSFLDLFKACLHPS